MNPEIITKYEYKIKYKIQIKSYKLIKRSNFVVYYKMNSDNPIEACEWKR